MISDMELLRAAHPATDTPRSFAVVYRDGTKVHFGVDTLEEAKRYGREYGMRVLEGERVHSVEEVTL